MFNFSVTIMTLHLLKDKKMHLLTINSLSVITNVLSRNLHFLRVSSKKWKSQCNSHWPCLEFWLCDDALERLWRQYKTHIWTCLCQRVINTFVFLTLNKQKCLEFEYFCMTSECNFVYITISVSSYAVAKIYLICIFV